jgi:hypothetical protein
VSNFQTDTIRKFANASVEELRKVLMEHATLLVAYPDMAEEKSRQSITTIDLCNRELRRRF